MSLIADGLLIATCLTTALYCFVLSRRLRKLSNTETGVGQQILQLNAALDETRAAVGEMRETGRDTSDRLARDIQQARRQAAQLSRLIEEAAKPSPAPSRAPAGGRSRGRSYDDSTGPASVHESTAEAAAAPPPEEPLGDVQLGFLPDGDDAEAPDIRLEASVGDELGVEDADEASSGSGGSADLDAPDAEKAAPGTGGKLLKVERMAL